MFEFFRKAAPETKSGAPGGPLGGTMFALSLSGSARWSGRDAAALARSGVMGNAIAYACVRKIAGAAASVPFLLYDGANEIEEHPLLALLARPNAAEDGPALFERWYGFLHCAGMPIWRR